MSMTREELRKLAKLERVISESLGRRMAGEDPALVMTAAVRVVARRAVDGGAPRHEFLEMMGWSYDAARLDAEVEP